MNVLVTGGLGFIGSNLVKSLKSKYNVTVIDNLLSESSNIENSEDNVSYLIEDAANIFEFRHSLPDKIDYIFHLAGHSRMQPSFNNPLSVIRNNILSTLVICDFARLNRSKVIYAGSSSCYDFSGYYNAWEPNDFHFRTPYTFSKWQGEQICEMYSQLYGLKYVIGRFFNVYGGKQPFYGKFATVIGIFEDQYKNGKNLTIVGDGNQKRDFTHVSDICQGLIKLAESPDAEGLYNLGTGSPYSINEIADFIIKNGNKKIEKVYLPLRRNESDLTQANISKTVEDTGWIPKIKLFEYLKNYLNGNN